jgi:hypothetical protein
MGVMIWNAHKVIMKRRKISRKLNEMQEDYKEIELATRLS